MGRVERYKPCVYYIAAVVEDIKAYSIEDNRPYH